MARKILHLLSGSIACAKASGLTSAWVKQGHQVRVACTPSVSQFVGKATLEGFSGHPVLDDTFASGQVMDHIHLAEWADLVVAAPATSNLINKLACGLADDVVSSLWQAAYGRRARLVIVPAMNSHMWDYPATRENIARLESWGVNVLPTAEGNLACGEFGSGRMLEVDEILQRIEALYATPDGPADATESPNKTMPGRSAHSRSQQAKTVTGGPKRILVTAGGTREPIDSVRYIGNLSSGRTAARLSEKFARAGHQVTWLGGAGAELPASETSIEQIGYVSFADLRDSLGQLLAERNWDAVVHAAAVSDYHVAAIAGPPAENDAGSRKLPSNHELELRLRPNPKLIDNMRSLSRNRGVLLIGFKLTDSLDQLQRQQAVARLFERAGVDAVVHNDVQDISPARHPVTLHYPGGEARNCADVSQLAEAVMRLLSDQAET